MSFNKRIFNWDKIVLSSSCDSFEFFDKIIMKPDAYITECELSSNFINIYTSSKIENRMLLKSLVLERETFISEFFRFYFVVRDGRNEKRHEEGLENYKLLFFSKWADLAEKYKNILEI